MIRTGDEYRASLQDGREVWIAGERVEDVTTHPMFRPLVDIRARIYDMQHEAHHREAMTYTESGEDFAVGQCARSSNRNSVTVEHCACLKYIVCTPQFPHTFCEVWIEVAVEN